jgi:ornithine--oxo-acid transaminase
MLQNAALRGIASRCRVNTSFFLQTRNLSASTETVAHRANPSDLPASEPSSANLIEAEHKFSAHNYHPVPVVFAQAKDGEVWDPEGRRYLDFLSAYSAVNQGHGNQKIINALVEQAQRLTLSSRAFPNDKFPDFARTLTSMFGYDMMLPMNTGAEGVETAIKLARKWGYTKKGIPKDEAIIISCCGCFHGRTMAAISMSCDSEATRDFGPAVGGHAKVDFGDANALAILLKEHGDNVAAFLFEPIQGEAGVILPPDGYLKTVRELCTKHNVLMIADEIQTGIARTGRLLACDWEDVRPDVVILGKALGAGVLPVSAVLADKDIMLCIKPGEHGSTFGGNPLASAVGIAALEVVTEENLCERADKMGEDFRQQLCAVQESYPHMIKEVRGRGLLNAVELHTSGLGHVTAYDVCIGLKDRGILAKPTHGNIIRLSPPLTIKQEQIAEASKALQDVFEVDIPRMKKLHSGQPLPQRKPSACERCGRPN